MNVEGDEVEAPRVFITYAHDSPQHKDMVHQFASFLQQHVGLRVTLDSWSDGERQDWSLWATQKLKKAGFVLVIASPDYRRRADGDAPPHEGRGSQFESAMIRNELTRDLAAMTRRVLPVVLPGMSVDDIPAFLNPYSTTHYIVPDFTSDGVADLLAAITGQSQYQEPPRGPYRPTARTVRQPVVVTKAVPTVPDGAVLAPGAVVLVGSDEYVVHTAQFDEVSTSDPSVVTRQASALRLGVNDHVWMRQLEVRAHGEASTAAVEALRSEHRMTTTLQGRGVPSPVALVENGRLITAITSWGAGKSAEPLAGYLSDDPLDPGQAAWLLKELASLCRTLTRLHAHRVAHRALTPWTILVAGNSRLVLRDLGLAATDCRPGEADGDYQAPEQRRRTSGRPGPWTDVYQVAAVTYHLLTGRVPERRHRLPLSSLAPKASLAFCDTVDAALANDPRQRPSMAQLAGPLSVSGPIG